MAGPIIGAMAIAAAIVPILPAASRVGYMSRSAASPTTLPASTSACTSLHMRKTVKSVASTVPSEARA
jgi:hypothetical protein